MKKFMLLGLAFLLASSVVQAKVSIGDTNVEVLAPGKGFYGSTYSGSPVRMLEIDSAGDLEFDNGATGSSFSGAVTFDSTTTFSGDPTFSSSTTLKPLMSLTNTNADATSSELKFVKDSASPADNDDLGRMTAYGDDSTGTSDKFIELRLEATDVTTANEDAKATLDIITAGTVREYLGIGDASVVINDDSIDMDVRIESDNDANALVVQGSDGAIGIGVADPDTQVEILAAGTQIKFSYDGSNYGTIESNASGNVIITGSDGFITKKQTISLDDDAEIALPTAVTGFLKVFVEGDNELAMVHVSDDGSVVTASVELGSVALTDSDTNLSIYDAGTGASIKNRLGSTKVISYTFEYK